RLHQSCVAAADRCDMANMNHGFIFSQVPEVHNFCKPIKNRSVAGQVRKGWAWNEKAQRWAGLSKATS
ncbi:hypothetical protein, partial [Pseudomonas syringae]|uniref:hypothetical protein n=1 Tax=Pseudomonas syringae TaxID=317 RepID=UPI0019D3AD1F